MTMRTRASLVLRASPEAFIKISDIEKAEDGSGYRGELSVLSGRFACIYAPFVFEDLRGFIMSVAKAYEQGAGAARLGHSSEQAFVEIEMHRVGHLSVRGFIVQDGPLRQQLTLSFGCHDTFVPSFLRSLNQVAIELERHESPPVCCPHCGSSRMARVLWDCIYLCGQDAEEVEAGRAIVATPAFDCESWQSLMLRRAGILPAWVCLACAPGWSQVHDLAMQDYRWELEKEAAVAAADFVSAVKLRDRQHSQRERLVAAVARMIGESDG